jgi:predicted ribosomally synthesized peptide with SipW-like signal peptide
MSLVVVLGLVGGGAFAYFSDTETSTGNTFSAGTLDVNVTTIGVSSDPSKVVVHDQVDGLNDYVTFTNVAPGDSGSIVWEITNTGSLPGWINVTQGLTNDTDNTNTEPELALEPGSTAFTDGELDEAMILTSSLKIDGLDVGFFPQPWVGTWHDIAVYGPQLDNLPIVLPAGKTLVLTYAWNIPTGVGNIIQGDTFTANFQVFLTQNHP